MKGSLRRHRYAFLAVFLIVLVIWYVSTAQESTRNSQFYRKTVAAIEQEKNEGALNPDTAGRPFLKGGSVRSYNDEGVKQVGRSVSTEDRIRAAESEIDAQMSKPQDLVAEVEALDRGLEDKKADANAGKTPEDIELERQIISARKREQEKLKAELRSQLKQKERARQKFLTHDKVMNPFWKGAAEKNRKPIGKIRVDEKAPDVDPFRDKVDKPEGKDGDEDEDEEDVDLDSQKEIERMPDVDPFRDSGVEVERPPPKKASSTEASGQEQTFVDEKTEQQRQKLAKEQDYLHPEPLPEKHAELAGAREPVEHISDKVAKGELPASGGNLHSEETKQRKAGAVGEGAPSFQTPQEARSLQHPPPARAAPASEAALMRPALLPPEPVDLLRSVPPAAVPEDSSSGGGPPLRPMPAAAAELLKESTPVVQLGQQQQQQQQQQQHMKEATPAVPAHKTPAELEFSRISALSPVVIFSKTYCPHSKKAKHILLQAFEITPTPYVVELDTHELGKELQALLAELTGRSTVPNVLIGGKSIGGGSEVEGLWEEGKLRDTIKKLGGKRVLAVVEDRDIH